MKSNRTEKQGAACKTVPRIQNMDFQQKNDSALSRDHPKKRLLVYLSSRSVGFPHSFSPGTGIELSDCIFNSGDRSSLVPTGVGGIPRRDLPDRPPRSTPADQPPSATHCRRPANRPRRAAATAARYKTGSICSVAPMRRSRNCRNAQSIAARLNPRGEVGRLRTNTG
jgi:hypothetical protein